MEPNPGIVEFLEKRSVLPIPRSELESWDTRRLLRRLETLRRCMEWIDDNDIYPEEVAQVSGRILLKGTPEWNEAWTDVKELLATREHVPRKKSTYSSKNRGRVQKSGDKRGTRRR